MKHLLAATSLALMAIPAQAADLAFWNLNNLGGNLTSQADGGSQSGAALLDWSSFSTAAVGGGSLVRSPADMSGIESAYYLSTLPSGTAAGTGLTLGLSINGTASIDFHVSTVGSDFLKVGGYTSSTSLFQGNHFLPGTWFYSVNGGNFTKASVSRTGDGEVTFTDHALADKANVTLRLQQQGTSGNLTYDNLAVSASTYSPIVLGGEADKRVVKGQAQLLNYRLSERAGVDQAYTFTSSNLTNVQDLVNGSNPEPTIIAGTANTISGFVQTTTANAGDTIAATVSAHGSTSNTTVSKTINVQVLDNRSLALVGDGKLGDVGRVVEGSTIGTVTIKTNEATDSEATRITLNAGTYYSPQGWSYSGGSGFTPFGGLSVTANTTTVFDSANESAELVLGINSGGQLGARTMNLDLKEAYATYSITKTPEIFKAEIAPGSNLSKVTPMVITANATVLRNRDLTADAINLGRQMVSTGTETVTGNATTLVRGGSLTDSQGTRVVLNQTTSAITANGVTATVGDTTLFNSANQTASVGVSYSTTFDRSVAGRQSAAVSIAGQLANGEAPQVNGVVVDTQLDVAVQKTYVMDRPVLGQSSVYTRVLAGQSVGTISNHIGTAGSDDQYTRITVGGHLFNEANDGFWDEVSVGYSSAVSTSATKLGTKSISVVGEGLAGEATRSPFEWEYGVEVYQRAAASVSAVVGGNATGTLATGNTGLVLGVGDNITVAAAAKSDAGNGYRSGVLLSSGFVGNDGFYLQDLSSFLAPGEIETGTIGFNSANKLNGIHSARLNLQLSNSFGLLGATEGDVGSYNFSVSHTVTGNSGNGGSAYVASGTRLKDAGIQSAFSNSVLSQATTAALKDSETLAGNTEIQLAFDGIQNATGTGASDLVSDTISLNGLHGIKFVLQVSYDEAMLINKFGTEEVAILTWLDPDDSTWKNAIEGNSNYGVAGAENAFGQRFRMSYDAYLALRPDGAPRLSDFGYDPTANTMWAVLDHNSEFGGSGYNAVPEPSIYALLMLGAVALWFVKRRSDERL